MIHTAARLRRALLLLGVFFLSACSDDFTAQDHLERARAYLEKPDPNAAYIELKNALDLQPESAETHWLLGKLFLASGNASEAAKFLQQAKERGWSEEQVQPLLAQSLLTLQKHEELLALHTESLPDAAKSEVLALQAFALLARQQLEEAASLAKASLDLNPQSSQAMLAQATVYATTNRTEEALSTLRDMVQATPENARAWHLIGVLNIQRGADEEATAAFSRAIEAAPQWPEPLMNRALLSFRHRDMEAARRDAVTLSEVAPDSPGYYYVQGLVYLEDRDYRELISAFGNAQQLSEAYPLIQYGLARAYLFTGAEAEARDSAKQYHSRFPDNIDGRSLLAAMQIRAREYSAARETLQPILDQNAAHWEALHMMAALEARDGRLGRSLSLYSWLHQLQPGAPVTPAPDNSELVAIALEQSGADNASTIEDKIASLRNFLAEEDFDSAIALARDLQWADATELDGHHVLTRVLLLAQRKREARGIINKALQRDAHDPVSNLFLAQFALEKEDFKAARHRYNKILEEYPRHLPTHMQLAALEAKEKRSASFLARLERAIETNPQSTAPRLAMALHYLRDGQPRQVEHYFDALSPLQRRAPTLTGTAIVAALAQGEKPLELEVVRKLLNALPGSEAFSFLLANVARERNRTAEVQAAWQSVLRDSPRHLPTVLGLTVIALKTGDPGRVAARAELLEQLSAGRASPLVKQVLAGAKAARGDIDAALKLAIAAFEESPSTMTLQELTSLQLRTGKERDAIRLMQSWLEDNPEDANTHLRLGQALEMKEDFDAAEEHYRSVIKYVPEHPVALNNLAWILREKAPRQALVYGRMALKAAPQQHQVLDTVAVIEHMNGKSKRALEILARALKIQPDYPAAHYHQALVLSETGKNKLALAILRNLLQQSQETFPERADAEALLRRLEE